MTTQLVPTHTATLNGERQPLVNARDLHTFLESGQDFSDWIRKRIEKYDFVEGQDFSINLWKTPTGGRPTTEYHITLDMAKELSMVERNAKGKQARRYFIAMEKQAHKGENEFAFELATLLTQNQTLKTELLKANSDYNAIKVMYDGGLENWQIGMAVNLSRHTISKRLTHLRKLGLIDDERGKHTPSEQLVQSVDTTSQQLALGV